LKGLRARQVFRLKIRGSGKTKSYGECTSNQRDRFVQRLFTEIEMKLDSIYRRGRGG
jgi:hypothetical protein